jgi:hypothetical protein
MAVYGRHQTVDSALGWKSVLFCCLGSQNQQKKPNGSVENKDSAKDHVNGTDKDGKGNRITPYISPCVLN